MRSPLFLFFAAAVLAGCSDSDTAITTDMHEDFDHEHKHQHTDDDDHEHEHESDFKGSHSHGHSHGHRHGDPLHGGRIVSVGHTHHKGGIAHFHAEVMPLSGNVIRFHVLTETEDGESKDHAIADREIPALISIKDQEANSADCTFKAVGEGEEASEFSMEIPEGVAEGKAFSIVIPKVKLGGIRQNFSFTVSREKSDNTETAETTDAEGESEPAAEDKADEQPAAASESSEESADE